MRAAWWWIDRWRKSTAYTDFGPADRGMYRDLLDEIWLRPDRVIPDDDEILGRIVGSETQWRDRRLVILSKFRRIEGGWTNDTALEVIAQAERRAEKQARYRSRSGNRPGNAAGNALGNQPGSPSPSPSPS